MGEKKTATPRHLARLPGWEWEWITRPGDVIRSITATGGRVNAGLIVMTTDGRNGFLDAFRGSHSERVLQNAPCPLLTLPAGSSG